MSPGIVIIVELTLVLYSIYAYSMINTVEAFIHTLNLLGRHNLLSLTFQTVYDSK